MILSIFVSLTHDIPKNQKIIISNNSKCDSYNMLKDNDPYQGNCSLTDVAYQTFPTYNVHLRAKNFCFKKIILFYIQKSICI